jgi:hypothetical protein
MGEILLVRYEATVPTDRRGTMDVLCTAGRRRRACTGSSKEQTFRSEDNAFLPLRRRQLSVRCVTTQSKWNGEPSTKKDFETEQSGVFSAPGSPLAHFLTAESGLILDRHLLPVGTFVYTGEISDFPTADNSADQLCDHGATHDAFRQAGLFPDLQHRIPNLS